MIVRSVRLVPMLVLVSAVQSCVQIVVRMVFAVHVVVEMPVLVRMGVGMGMGMNKVAMPMRMRMSMRVLVHMAMLVRVAVGLLVRMPVLHSIVGHDLLLHG